ncbi:hypothetical protein IID24_00160 [Patescibacteria group bacterium]|nr:hypothetical protein [Patescibacteria group bacterium]
MNPENREFRNEGEGQEQVEASAEQKELQPVSAAEMQEWHDLSEAYGNLQLGKGEFSRSQEERFEEIGEQRRRELREVVGPEYSTQELLEDPEKLNESIEHTKTLTKADEKERLNTYIRVMELGNMRSLEGTNNTTYAQSSLKAFLGRVGGFEKFEKRRLEGREKSAKKLNGKEDEWIVLEQDRASIMDRRQFPQEKDERLYELRKAAQDNLDMLQGTTQYREKLILYPDLAKAEIKRLEGLRKTAKKGKNRDEVASRIHTLSERLDAADSNPTRREYIEKKLEKQRKLRELKRGNMSEIPPGTEAIEARSRSDMVKLIFEYAQRRSE